MYSRTDLFVNHKPVTFKVGVITIANEFSDLPVNKRHLGYLEVLQINALPSVRVMSVLRDVLCCLTSNAMKCSVKICLRIFYFGADRQISWPFPFKPSLILTRAVVSAFLCRISLPTGQRKVHEICTRAQSIRRSGKQGIEAVRSSKNLTE